MFPRIVLRALLAGGIVLVLDQSGVAAALGAHPWWARRVGLVGVPVGLVLAVLVELWSARAGWKLATLGAAFLPVAGAGVAARERFIAAADFDAVAGRAWYLSWVAILALTVAALSLGLGRLRQR